MARTESEELAYQQGYAEGLQRGREEAQQQWAQDAVGQVVGGTGQAVIGGQPTGGVGVTNAVGRASIGGEGDYQPPKP